MAYQYLREDNVVEIFRKSRQYTEGLTDNFPEYERIMRNKPHSRVPKEYPKTTDGTTASIIRKTPHRIVQQLPTGRVHNDSEDWLSVVADFIYRKKIIPNANEGYALLQKSWSVIERFMGFGYCGTYAPFVQKNGFFSSDLRLVYWGDIFLQPGKLSDDDSNYVFIRSWWQTADIDALIASQESIPKDRRTWNVDNLRKIRKVVTTKEDKAQTPMEREKNIDQRGGIELITGFQRGVKSKFYTFNPQSGLVARTKINKDPRGEMPVSFAYGDIDGSNPFGRSIIELVGGLQNLMDAEMQMYQYNRALMLNPPLLKKGQWNKNKAKFAPNVIIDLGAGENNSLEPLTIDTTALNNFAQNYGLMKSQVLNLLASPDTSIGADVGNPGFSKTPQGVEANKANLSVDDNYVRKQFETWFERWSETAINLYFGERTGIEELQLDKDAIARLKELARQKKFDMNMVNDEGKIRINYSSATPKLRFEVDASSSKVQDEVAQLQALTGLNELLQKSETFQSIVPPEKQMQLWNAIVNNSSVQNGDQLTMTDKEIRESVKKAEEARIAEQEAVKKQERDIDSTNIKDLPDWAKLQWLAQKGFEPQTEEQAAEMDSTEQKIKKAEVAVKGQAAMKQEQPAESPEGLEITPEHLLKADDQAHRQSMDEAKLELEHQKVADARVASERQAQVAQQGADTNAKAQEASAKQTEKKSEKKEKK